jgi:RsiW-degrading membrane proteinase PrsW (M82 family)
MENEQKAELPVHKPDVKEKIFFFLSGLLVSVPFTLFFSGFADTLCVALPQFLGSLCSTVLFAPFIEEFAKVFPLFYRHGETQRSLVNLAILTGLGFGITELALYVLVLGAPIVARVPGVFFHASSASITAYGIALKKPLVFYLIAVSLHLANNFFALLINALSFVPVLTVLVIAYFLAWRLYNQTSENVVV